MGFNKDLIQSYIDEFYILDRCISKRALSIIEEADFFILVRASAKEILFALQYSAVGFLNQADTDRLSSIIFDTEDASLLISEWRKLNVLIPYIKNALDSISEEQLAKNLERPETQRKREKMCNSAGRLIGNIAGGLCGGFSGAS